MGLGVDILIAISKKHLHYSLFVKRIIATEAQLFTFWAWSDYNNNRDSIRLSMEQHLIEKAGTLQNGINRIGDH